MRTTEAIKTTKGGNTVTNLGKANAIHIASHFYNKEQVEYKKNREQC